MRPWISTPMERLDLEGSSHAGREIFVKRMDLSHSLYGGNKLLKLWPLMFSPEQIPSERWVSMGGPHSNHLFSLAGLCHEQNISLQVLVRQGYLEHETYILQMVRAWGAELIYVDREEFRRWRDHGAEICRSQYPGAFWVPEGGSFGEVNEAFIQLVQECVWQGLDEESTLLIPTGTGGTAAGILMALAPDQKVILINSVPGFPLEQRLREWLPAGRFNENIRIWSTRALGRFGTVRVNLLDFSGHWQAQFSIPLDPVYTSRMMYLLWQHLDQGDQDLGKKIICLHTGGHAGARSWEQAYGLEFTPPGIRPDI